MSITPLEQFANPNLFLPIPIFSIGLSKLSLYGLIILGLVLGFFTFPLLNSRAFVGTRWTITLETFYISVSSILKEQVKGGFSEYIPVIVSLFTFLLFANLFSNIPYSYGYTTSVIVCLGLSFIIFIGVTLIGLSTHKLAWFSFFVPSGSPLALVPLLVIIEFISYIARAFSLGIRLLANLVSGHVLMSVLSSMIWTVVTKGFLFAFIALVPLTIFTGLFVLELAVSVIQSYVFTLLFASYLNDAINLH